MRIARITAGRYRSGQTGRTVNPLALPSAVRIRLSPPTCVCVAWCSAKVCGLISRERARSGYERHSRMVLLRTAVLLRVSPESEPRGCSSVRGCSSMVERQPSKLNAWVRFPSPAPFSRSFFCACSTYPVPRGQGRPEKAVCGRGRRCCSSVVEHFLGKEEAMGSIPISSSISFPLSRLCALEGPR